MGMVKRHSQPIAFTQFFNGFKCLSIGVGFQQPGTGRQFKILMINHAVQIQKEMTGQISLLHKFVGQIFPLQISRADKRRDTAVFADQLCQRTGKQVSGLDLSVKLRFDGMRRRQHQF